MTPTSFSGFTKAALSVAPLLCCLAAFLSHFLIGRPWFIVAIFWAGTAGALISLFFIRRAPLFGILSILVSLFGLVIAAETALTFTLWFINGFAP